MCTPTCLCNSCYKKHTCSDCYHIPEHINADCFEKGVEECDYYIKRRWNDNEDKYNVETKIKE